MLNKVILIGNVGQDPAINQAGDSRVAKFSLATSSTYKDKAGQRQTATEWHNITLWGKLSDIVEQYVKKGDKLMIEGSIHTRTWEKDGQKHYSTEIKAENIIMLGGKQTAASSPVPESVPSESGDFSDLPF